MRLVDDVLRAVKATLKRGGMADVFLSAPSALRHPQPIVATYLGYSAVATDGDEAERGTLDVGVVCCRELSIEALEAAYDCAEILREAEWEFPWLKGASRVLACDVEAPGMVEVDDSGRYTCGLTCHLTTVRER